MTAPQTPTPGMDPARGVASVHGAPRPAARGASAAGGTAFRALLDQLEGRAGALAEKSRAELDASDLSAAVGEARASLQDALQLSSELLEAWRQSKHQTHPSEP